MDRAVTNLKKNIVSQEFHLVIRVKEWIEVVAEAMLLHTIFQDRTRLNVMQSTNE